MIMENNEKKNIVPTAGGGQETDKNKCSGTWHGGASGNKAGRDISVGDDSSMGSPAGYASMEISGIYEAPADVGNSESVMPADAGYVLSEEYNDGFPELPEGGSAADTEDVDYPPTVWGKLSRILSLVMGPLLLPVYAILILLYGRTIMAYVPGRTKMFFILVVTLNTLIVPALFIGFLKTTGHISKLNLKDRSDRILPLLVTALCYALCAYMVSSYMIGFLVRKIMISGAVCILFAAVVSFFWKISLHMVALGGTLAILILLTVANIGFFQPWIIALVVISGLTASARLYLGRHTPLQVAAGFFAGFFIASFVMLVR